LREQIALCVGEANGCEYCLAAHTVIGKNAGLGEVEIYQN
jgi:AhpD family alkylhydroperoxidase